MLLNEYKKTLFDDGGRVNELEAVKYLESLGASMNEDVYSIDLEKRIFIDGEFPLDRKLINKQFSKVILEGPEEPKEEVVLDDEQVEGLKKLQKYHHDSALRTHKLAYESAKRTYFDREKEAQAALANYLEKKKFYSRLKPEDTHDVVDFVNRLTKDGWYSLHSVGKEEIKFNTKEIILSKVNSKAGMNIVANLGMFMVCLNYKTQRIWVDPYSNNLTIDGSYHHPHVSGNEVCLGNAKAAYNNHMENMDYYEALNLIKELLCNYNEASPYVDLERFAIKWRANQGEKIKIHHRALFECNDCGHEYESDWYEDVEEVPTFLDCPAYNDEYDETCEYENERSEVEDRITEEEQIIVEQEGDNSGTEEQTQEQPESASDEIF